MNGSDNTTPIEYQWKEESETGQEKEKMILKIDIGDDVKYLKLYDNSRPEQWAYDFSVKNNLNFEVLENLTEQIRRCFNENNITTGTNGNNTPLEKIQEKNQNCNPEDNEICLSDSLNNHSEKNNFSGRANDSKQKNLQGTSSWKGGSGNANVISFANHQMKNKGIINSKNSANKEAGNHINIRGNSEKRNENYSDIKGKNITYRNSSNNTAPKNTSYLRQTLSSKSKANPDDKMQNATTTTNVITTNSIKDSQNLEQTKSVKTMSKSILDEPQKQLNKSFNSTWNYGERLYRKELKLQEKRNEKIDELRFKISEDEKKHNTFRPKINNISFQALTNRFVNKRSYNDYDNILYYKDIIQIHREQLKHKFEMTESEYEFSPKINKRSKTMDKQRNNGSTPRYEQWYANYEKQKYNIKCLGNRIYDKDVLFKPSINNYQCPSTNILFHERLQQYRVRSSDKHKKLVEQVESPIDAKTNTKWFVPKINDYEPRPESFNTFSNLYLDSFKTLQRKQELTDMTYYQTKKEQNKSHVTPVSKEIFEARKEKCFKKVFNILDKDRDGHITKVSVNMKGLPKKIQWLIAPIIDELKEQDENWIEAEFVTACFHWYEEILQFNERRDLLTFGSQNAKESKDWNLGTPQGFTFKPKVNKKYNDRQGDNIYYKTLDNINMGKEKVGPSMSGMNITEDKNIERSSKSLRSFNNKK